VSRAHTLAEGTFAALGAVAFTAAILGGWLVFDPAPDLAAPAGRRAPQQAVRHCPAPESFGDLSRDDIATLLAQLEEGRP
jgi:hypothetical protein